MNAIITAVVALLGEILPLIQTSSNVASIIATLIQIIPTLVKEAQDLVQPVKNIIAALQVNDATSLDQLATLRALDAQVDADFEAAATKVIAEDGP